VIWLLPVALLAGGYAATRALAPSPPPPPDPWAWKGYGPPPTPAPAPAGGGGGAQPSAPPAAGYFRLVPGTKYRAVLVLAGVEAVASNSMIAAELRKLMKAPVMVTDSRPAGWAVAAPSADFFDSVRWAETVYAGVTRDVKLPSQIRKVWTA
jgi:hypothetical protein